jgi:hypothetical protein
VAVLAALSLTHGAGEAAVSAALAGVTTRFGLLVAAGQPTAGMIPPHVAALAAGATKAMFLSNTKTAVLNLLTGCLLGAATERLARQLFAARQQPAAEPKTQVANQASQPVPAKESAGPAEGAEDAKGTVEVSGCVVGPDGKPVAGAFVTSTVVAPDGKPLAGVHVNGLGGGRIENLATAEFRLPVPGPLFFYQRDKNLGAAVLFKDDVAMPVRVRLEACATLTGVCWIGTAGPVSTSS